MLKNVLSEDTIILDIKVRDKIDLFDKISKLAKEQGVITDVQGVIEDFYEKEQNTETYLGVNCAIPHARSSRILKNTIFFVRTSKAIKWSDEASVNIVFVIFAKGEDVDGHIDMLMSVSKKVMENKVMETLRVSENIKEILEVLK